MIEERCDYGRSVRNHRGPAEDLTFPVVRFMLWIYHLREIVMKKKVQKWGNSRGLRFPRSILRKAHIAVGDEVEIISRAGSIVVKPGRDVHG